MRRWLHPDMVLTAVVSHLCPSVQASRGLWRCKQVVLLLPYKSCRGTDHSPDCLAAGQAWPCPAVVTAVLLNCMCQSHQHCDCATACVVQPATRSRGRHSVYAAVEMLLGKKL